MGAAVSAGTSAATLSVHVRNLPEGASIRFTYRGEVVFGTVPRSTFDSDAAELIVHVWGAGLRNFPFADVRKVAIVVSAPASKRRQIIYAAQRARWSSP